MAVLLRIYLYELVPAAEPYTTALCISTLQGIR